MKKTKEEIDKLNLSQQDNMYHPLTCANDGDDIHIKYEFDKLGLNILYQQYLEKEIEKGIPYPHIIFTETNLIATEEGWICPVCNYKQSYI